MAENRFSCNSPLQNGGREMVCIETNRVLDSCRDRDCYENVRVFLTDFGREIVERTNSIRVKHSCIAGAFIGIDPVQFNRGFYAVDIKFYVRITFEACVGAGRSQEFEGVAAIEKKVVLYGGESNVSIFKSNPDTSDYCSMPDPCCTSKNVPIAVVEVVDPIILNVKVVEDSKDCNCCCCCCDIPSAVSDRLNSPLNDTDDDERYLVVSIGLFSVVRIVRPAQYLVNATEYCIPDKECVAGEENNPCNLFRSMAFPVNEFCPGSNNGSFYSSQNGGNCQSDRKCGCNG